MKTLKVIWIQYNCSERSITPHIVYNKILIGRWAIDIHGTVSRQCCGRARVVWTVSLVAMSDSRPYRWRPPEVTRESQFELGSCRRRTCLGVYAAFLKGADVF